MKQAHMNAEQFDVKSSRNAMDCCEAPQKAVVGLREQIWTLERSIGTAGGL